MRGNKGYKHQKRRGHGGRHVQLPEWLQASPAWATLKPGPRALYVELKRRFNGSNNGSIILSHREAALALNVNRNTVGAYFEKLEAREFIRMMQGPFLGPSGIGQTALWALDEVPLAPGEESRRGFMRWKPPTDAAQEPRTKNRTARPEKQDA